MVFDIPDASPTDPPNAAPNGAPSVPPNAAPDAVPSDIPESAFGITFIIFCKRSISLSFMN